MAYYSNGGMAMAKAAIYCRVSSDEQAEKGTIEGQVQYAKKYMELHGPEACIEEYEFYLDEGVSGALPLAKRPAGALLIADAKAGKFKALYVYRLDRLARSVKHVLDTYDILESRNIALKSMTEAFDTGTPTGKFFMTLLASIAALERDTILERTQMGKDRAVRQGRWASGPPPYGYRVGTDGCLEVYEPEARIVRLIFQLYLESMSTVEVAKYLNARGVLTPSKSKCTNNASTGKWHAGHISIILRTEAYYGKYTYLTRSKRRRETITMDVPAIIDKHDYAAAQAKLVENADVARGNRGKRHYLLRGVIFCGNCGRAMVGTTGNSKAGRVYYRCSNAYDAGAGKACNAKLIRAKDIEDAVWLDIVAFAKNPGRIIEIMQERIKQNSKDLTPVKNEINEVEKAILDKQTARGKVLSLCARGIITDQEAETELQSLAREMEALTSRRGHLFSRMDAAQKVETETLTAQAMLDTLAERIDNLSDEEKAEVIRGITRRVNVYTLVNEEGKRYTKAEIHYLFEKNSCMELSISRNSYNHTTLLDVETTWLFKPYNRSKGTRVRLN
jgi:site-specific DNA recombinase